ncbi:hypothetical protein CXB51_003757 [Gossypium anomalum]|uniref:Aminotransferase-like plant mobile domain-containing protein n=1 Tax=Gossypium anomalum TaxID=47600 RepID=A0A8J6DDX1_9ROSI|nr:hypothetical protein CXB51_003757 [Gossypium anomalum]
MGSLIDNTNHISSAIKEMESYLVLRGRVNSIGFQPDECLIPFLELAGFGSAALIRTFDLRYDLISALVKRWRLETHTFHLPCGECTITLEDVAVQLGLPIDGNAVTGISSISRPATLCYELLGRSPSEGKFASLRLSWLKDNFEYLPSTANEREVMQAVRAYIMHLIGGVLMTESNGSTVHLMYLPLLSNLHNTRSYNWGSALLAMLYRELCRTTDPSAMDIGGCLILLQSWAHYQMPFLASISHQSYIFPLVNRWSTNSGIGRSYTVPIYCLMIENHSGEGFIWMPYSVLEIMVVIPSSARVHSNLWRGRHGLDWGDEHDEYVTMWNNWFERVPQMDRGLDLQPSLQYLQWYCEIGKPFLFGGRSMVVPPHTTRIGQHLPDSHHAPEPEPQQDLEPELHSGGSSYHPDLGGDNYFSGSSGHGYHSKFDIFSPLPPQYSNHLGSYLSQYSTPSGPHPSMYSTLPEPYPPPYSTPPGPYPLPYFTPLGSSSSMAFETYDFSSMFHTPPHTNEKNVDRHSRPQRERRAPQKYTPRTTPSNHQF